MVKVEFLGPIGEDPIEVNASSLQELADILANNEKISPWLVNSAVAVNDVMVKDNKHTLKDGDIVSILPPVCGG